MEYLPCLDAPMDKETVAAMDPLVLAYVGDSVQSLYVRTALCANHHSKAGALHGMSIGSVSAAAQAEAVDRVRALFCAEEDDIYRLARNHKTKSSAKNATLRDYHKASGLEAVFGYLYLTGQKERLAMLLAASKGEQL